jgi:ribose 5-phosphate isomerase A
MSMTADELKRLVGQAALAYVTPGSVIGVGTGSTVNHFIDALAKSDLRIAGALSSSEQTSQRLYAHGIVVRELHEVQRLSVYIDGADEINPQGHMIKGGGAALTREKIVANAAERFVCIADDSKWVQTLGQFPLPVEVIAMAATQVAQQFKSLGGQAVLRPGVRTDNGHPVLDVQGLQITDPEALEREINQWPGVITVGIFARNRAHVCLLGTPGGVRTHIF